MRISQYPLIFGFLLVLMRLSHASGEPTKPIGWTPSPFFEVLENAQDTPEFHREFYPKGEGASHWTERVVVASRPVAPGTTPASILDALLEKETAQCPTIKEDRFPIRAEDQPVLGLAMWHCPINETTSRGEVAIHRVLLSADRAFVITAQGDYPPFEKGKSPLLKGQLDRWIEFQKSFALCSDWTAPGCLPDGNLIMHAPAAELTADEAEAVRAAEQRGNEIYRQDQIAWHGTDYALQEKVVKFKKGGFVAVAGPNLSGHFYLIELDARHPDWVRVDFDDVGTPSISPKERSLPESIRMRFAALAVARKAALKSCSDRINTAVLPDDVEGGWLVYFLSATMQRGHMFLGGHTRVHVDQSASRILSTEYSANTCLTIDFDADSDAVTPVVTNIVSAVPWETHVFQSLTFHKDLIVITAHAVWRIGNGKITKLKVE